MNFYPFVIGSAVLMINLYFEKYRQDDLAQTLTELKVDAGLPRIKTYDFIVGGGGAGCVVTRRLSVSYSVLLLEAGGNPVPAADTLTFYNEIEFNQNISYAFDSVPQAQVAPENNRNLRVTVGKMLGGSTSHNGLAFTRGYPLDYDNWANLTNDPSWKYENVLKYFKKLETHVGSGSKDEHGFQGPMEVHVSNTPELPLWLEAGKELGYETYPDPNGPQRLGFSPGANVVRNGRRESSYTAYIKPIEGRRSLRIERYSEVSKILFDENKNALGVEYKRHGIPQIVRANKEIIISAGVFGSPLLLVKSGIGPSNVLKEAQIPLVKDLPVGNTLTLHPRILGRFNMKDTSLFQSREEDLTEGALTDFHKYSKGIVTIPFLRGLAFLESSRAKTEDPKGWPDIQISYGAIGNGDDNPNFVVYCTRPRSRGRLEFNTTALRTGVGQAVWLDPQFFTDESDLDVMIEGIQTTFKIFENTTSFQGVGMKFSGKKHPACKDFKLRSDDYWRCYIKQRCQSSHQGSTCKMGSGPEDASAVVDSKLRVLGIGRLRVVDASVMPIVTNSNIMASVIMLAEKASDEILKHWKQVGVANGG